MNRTDYIKELDRRLRYIPKEDREDAIEYYRELMDDMGIGETENAEEKLGSAKEAAKKILDECTQKHVDAYNENKTAKGSATVIWLTVLGVLSLPLSIPLAIVVMALAFSVGVVALTLTIALFATAAALVVAGLACLVFMWLAPGLAQKAVVLGAGLVSLGLGILLGYGLCALVGLIIRKVFRRKQ